MNHLFVINPFAGDGSYKKVEETVYKLSKLRKDIFVAVSQYQRHCEKILKDYRDKDISRVYSVGGDGSFHDIVNCLMKEDLAKQMGVGIIPTGSGNDYIRNFTNYTEFSKIKNYWEYIHDLMESKTIPVDVGKVNEDYFINVMSVGFDAQVIENSSLFKKNIFVPSKSVYFLSALYTIVKLKNYTCKVSTDNGQKFEDFLMISIGKGRYYGGGMKVLPNADISDGQLDICVVDPLKRRAVFPLIKTFIDGKHEKLSIVSLIKSTGLELYSKEEIPYQLDGELKRGDQWKIRIIPKAISLIKPL